MFVKWWTSQCLGIHASHQSYAPLRSGKTNPTLIAFPYTFPSPDYSKSPTSKSQPSNVAGHSTTKIVCQSAMDEWADRIPKWGPRPSTEHALVLWLIIMIGYALVDCWSVVLWFIDDWPPLCHTLPMSERSRQSMPHKFRIFSLDSRYSLSPCLKRRPVSPRVVPRDHILHRRNFHRDCLETVLVDMRDGKKTDKRCRTDSNRFVS